MKFSLNIVHELINSRNSNKNNNFINFFISSTSSSLRDFHKFTDPLTYEYLFHNVICLQNSQYFLKFFFRFVIMDPYSLFCYGIA